MSKKKLAAVLPMRVSFWLNLSLLTGILLVNWACQRGSDKLPFLGDKKTVQRTTGGKQVTDTIYHAIPAFSFVDQYGDTVTDKTVANKIYVADFFFTTCPTICPKMKTQMKRLYERFKGNNAVMILSHTIDPAHDSVAILNEFAGNLGVTGKQWLFLTGPREKIYEIGQDSYMVTAAEDKSAPGGVVHSGAFVLIDKDKHVRGVYDGTTEKGVNQLMSDMDKLLAEKKG